VKVLTVLIMVMTMKIQSRGVEWHCCGIDVQLVLCVRRTFARGINSEQCLSYDSVALVEGYIGLTCLNSWLC
jgi:hypothetical protein